VILVVGEEKGGVLDWSGTGENRPVRSADLTDKECTCMVTIFMAK